MDAPPLEARGLTKRYGSQRVVDDLSFAIAPGRVTGFVGPNGAGKTTTLRIALGLCRPDAGDVRVFGHRYPALPDPNRSVGALIDASGFHPSRRIRHELAIHAQLADVDQRRVPVVLDEVGLADAADKRVSQLSLGMRQRLGLAAALLAEPRLLVLDEPANGLDPAGAHWLRGLLRAYTERGAAVLVSSHVLSELAQFADDVVVINRGRLVTESPIASLLHSTDQVYVESAAPPKLAQALRRHKAHVRPNGNGVVVSGLSATEVGEIAAAQNIALRQLRTESSSLEEVFLELTDEPEASR